MTGLEALLRSPRYEVFPAKGAERAVADWVPAGMTVTVTASPVKGLDATVELTERLVNLGYRVVPHLAARSVANQAHLDGIVARLTAAGCDDVFVPGGDAPHPAAVAGASESARFITRHPGWILRFWVPGGYNPDRLLDRAATAITAPDAGVAGLHLFTFNQLQQAEQWRRAALERTGIDKPLLAG